MEAFLVLWGQGNIEFKTFKNAQYAQFVYQMLNLF